MTVREQQRTDTAKQPLQTTGRGAGLREGELEGPLGEMEVGHGNGTWELLVNLVIPLGDRGQRFEY